jgi:hypothetical protein
MAAKTKPVEIQCETCQFWNQGDQSPIENRIGNVGNCVYMMIQGESFYDKPDHVPFWAGRLLHQTISWEGNGCPTWKESK